MTTYKNRRYSVTPTVLIFPSADFCDFKGPDKPVVDKLSPGGTQSIPCVRRLCLLVLVRTDDGNTLNHRSSPQSVVSLSVYLHTFYLRHRSRFFCTSTTALVVITLDWVRFSSRSRRDSFTTKLTLEVLLIHDSSLSLLLPSVLGPVHLSCTFPGQNPLFVEPPSILQTGFTMVLPGGWGFVETEDFKVVIIPYETQF